MNRDDITALIILGIASIALLIGGYKLITWEPPMTRGEVCENSIAYINRSSEGVFFHKESQCPNIYNEYFVDTIKNYPSGHPCYICFPISIHHTFYQLRDDRSYEDCSGWQYVVNKVNERIYYRGRY